MSSDEDDDELAQLRAQRAARLGTAGLTVSAARQQQQRQAEPSGSYYEDEPARPSNGASARSRPAAGGGDSDDDAPAVVDEAEMFSDGLRGQFPLAFGEQEKKPEQKLEDVHAATLRRDEAAGAGPVPLATEAPEEEQDDEFVGPPRVLAEVEAPEGGVDEIDDSSEDPYHLPVTHEVALQSHEKLVTAMDIDKAGARVATGSADYKVRLYDFGGMKSNMRGFREFEPADGYPINALSFSPTGELLLVVTGSSQAKVYDRDGHELGEFLKGDMYIRDMKNTKGHTYRLCDGAWHPTDRYTAMTCSEDGTVRVWDTEGIKQKTVLKPTLQKPGRVAVTACTYNADGSLIGAGLTDGSIQLWDVKGNFGRSAAVGQVAAPKAQMLGKQDWRYASGSRHHFKAAHQPGSEVACLRFTHDATTLVSRATDETLKMWDIRKLKAPLHVWDELPCTSAARLCFSPDESLILTGTEADREGKGGAVHFFDRHKLTLVRRVAMPGSVTAVAWHERINQIFVGTGDRKSGSAHVLYDPTFSEKGVLLAAGRKPRAEDPLDFQAPLIIKNPHALPMYRDDDQQRSRKRQREKDADDAVKSRKPDPGVAVSGLGKGGRIGATGGTLLTQYILKNQAPHLMQAVAEEDIRAAILRHGDAAKDEMASYTAAYAKTQPKPIYAQEEDEEEDG